jgi:hypothetical protein
MNCIVIVLVIFAIATNFYYQSVMDFTNTIIFINVIYFMMMMLNIIKHFVIIFEIAIFINFKYSDLVIIVNLSMKLVFIILIEII